MAEDERGPQLADLFPDSAVAGAALRARGWRVAVAESCTGGLLGAALTAVPGSSAYVLGGVIAYDNAVKIRLLDVAPGTLAQHGAVSEEVAAAMARGVRERLGAEVGVSTTGVAGPGSEEGGKPAGLVFIALAAPGVERLVRLDGDHGREGNRTAAVHAALELLVGLA
jgi:PncC family amidohydrolase